MWFNKRNNLGAQNKTEVLVLVPDLSLKGGVSQLFKNLSLEENECIQYFVITTSKGSIILKILEKFKIFISFLKKILTKNVKVIHLNPSFDFKSFIREAIFLYISLFFKKKVVVYFHGWSEEFEKSLHRSSTLKFIWNTSYKKADIIFVLGNIFNQKVKKLGISDKTKILISTNAFDHALLTDFDIEKKIGEIGKGKIKILFMARIIKEKGIYIALETYKIIKDLKKEVELIIAGDGPELANVKRITFEQAIPGVKFTGYVTGERKVQILKESSLYLLPTFHGEGIPVSMIEAMAFGLPIITRPVGGIPDIIKNGINGYLVNELDPAVFSECILSLIENPQLRVAMAMENYRSAINKYSNVVVRERLLKVYKELLQENI